MQAIRKLSKFNMRCVVSVSELFHKEIPSTDLGDYDKSNSEYKFKKNFLKVRPECFKTIKYCDKT